MFVSPEQFTVKVFKNSGLNHIGSVMVSMLAWSMVDHGFTVESNQSHGRVKPKTIQLVFAAFSLSVQN